MNNKQIREIAKQLFEVKVGYTALTTVDKHGRVTFWVNTQVSAVAEQHLNAALQAADIHAVIK